MSKILLLNGRSIYPPPFGATKQPPKIIADSLVSAFEKNGYKPNEINLCDMKFSQDNLNTIYQSVIESNLIIYIIKLDTHFPMDHELSFIGEYCDDILKNKLLGFITYRETDKDLIDSTYMTEYGEESYDERSEILGSLYGYTVNKWNNFPHDTKLCSIEPFIYINNNSFDKNNESYSKKDGVPLKNDVIEEINKLSINAIKLSEILEKNGFDHTWMNYVVKKIYYFD